jgi:hypothetical protein
MAGRKATHFFQPCEACSRPFKVHVCHPRKFCSLQCKAADDRAAALTKFTCPQCGNESWHQRAVAARMRYCSAKCWHVAANHFTGYVGRQGYKRITVDGRNDYAEHRHVMEQRLGRKLYPGEIVHHINGDRTFNHPDNLELWSRKDPPGQRVSDQIAWAKDLLSRYPEMGGDVVKSDYILTTWDLPIG